MDTKQKNRLSNNTWYHGTNLCGWKQICKLGIQADFNKDHELDFGYGFYLTPDKKGAENYIERIMQIQPNSSLEGINSSLEGINSSPIPLKSNEDKKIPVIIEFNFVPADWIDSGYKYAYFPSYDDKFAEFVFHNRTQNVGGNDQHEYDFIYGVMSDSIPTKLILDFNNGEISKEDVLSGLKKSTSAKQLSIHSQSLCDIIMPSKAYQLYDKKELDIDEYFKNKSNRSTT